MSINVPHSILAFATENQLCSALYAIAYLYFIIDPLLFRSCSYFICI